MLTKRERQYTGPVKILSVILECQGQTVTYITYLWNWVKGTHTLQYHHYRAAALLGLPADPERWMIDCSDACLCEREG